MQYRQLGKTGLSVSEIGFGAWGIGGAHWGGARDSDGLAALRCALDCGVNFVDTAAAYGRGHSEQLIAKIYRQRSGKFTVASKVPPKDWTWPPKADATVRQVFPRAWIRSETEKTLRNLKMDCLDIQQLHVWNANWIEDLDWLEEVRLLKQEGKIKFFGVSLNDRQPDSGLALAASGVVDTLQVVYNIFDQSAGQNLFPACQKYNVGIIARVPLDEGSLTGKLTLDTRFPDGDFRQWYFAPAILPEVVQRVDKIRAVFDGSVKTLVEGALKFCLSHPAVSTVIAGMRNADQARQNASASSAAPLSPHVLQALQQHHWPRF